MRFKILVVFIFCLLPHLCLADNKIQILDTEQALEYWLIPPRKINLRSRKIQVDNSVCINYLYEIRKDGKIYNPQFVKIYPEDNHNLKKYLKRSLKSSEIKPTESNKTGKPVITQNTFIFQKVDYGQFSDATIETTNEELKKICDFDLISNEKVVQDAVKTIQLDFSNWILNENGLDKIKLGMNLKDIEKVYGFNPFTLTHDEGGCKYHSLGDDGSEYSPISLITQNEYLGVKDNKVIWSDIDKITRISFSSPKLRTDKFLRVGDYMTDINYLYPKSSKISQDHYFTPQVFIDYPSMGRKIRIFGTDNPKDETIKHIMLGENGIIDATEGCL